MKIKVAPTFVTVFTFGFASAITLYPFGIYLKRKEYLQYKGILNHEMIHWEQQKEMHCVPFYVRYIVEWIRTGFKYRMIAFEREAYENELVDGYLEKREKFAWIKYLTK